MYQFTKIFFILTLVSSVLSFTKPSLHGFPLVEGEVVPIERAPYQASLLYYGWIFLCSGIILSEKVVLGAAHCNMGNPSQWLVHVGSAEKIEGGQKYPVEKNIVHEEFYNGNNDYDICLHILTNKMVIDGITTAIIPIVPPHYVIPEDVDEVFTSSWGATPAENVTDPLKAITYPVVEHSECVKLFEGHESVKITENVLCAGFSEKTCQGDSGAPLTVECFLVGMSSTAVGCAGVGLPGIWIKMTSVGPWIQQWIDQIDTEIENNE